MFVEIVNDDPSGEQRKLFLSKSSCDVSTGHSEPDGYKTSGGDAALFENGDNVVESVIEERLEIGPSGEQSQHPPSKSTNNVNKAHSEPGDDKSLGGDEVLSIIGDSAVNGVAGCMKHGGKEAAFTTANIKNNKKKEGNWDERSSKNDCVAGEHFSEGDSDELGRLFTSPTSALDFPVEFVSKFNCPVQRAISFDGLDETVQLHIHSTGGLIQNPQPQPPVQATYTAPPFVRADGISQHFRPALLGSARLIDDVDDLLKNLYYPCGR